MTAPPNNTAGFTLVETMVAISLAVLLTVLFASTLTQPKNTATADARAQMTLTQANSFQQSYANRTGTYYAGPTNNLPAWANIETPATTTLEFVSATASSYCAEATDENTPHTWSIIPGENATAITCAER